MLRLTRKQPAVVGPAYCGAVGSWDPCLQGAPENDSCSMQWPLSLSFLYIKSLESHEVLT